MNNGELTFRVNGDELVVRGYYGQDDVRAGFFFEEGGFQGWDDGGGEMSGDETKRPATHGLFNTLSTQGGRGVTASFVAIAPTWTELQVLRDRMMEQGATGDLMELRTTNRDVTRWASGKRSGLPTFTDAGRRVNRLIYASCEMQFLCPNPELYGETRQVMPGRSVTLKNNGNFPYGPRLTLSGAAPGGYTVTGPGGAVRVVRPLVEGKPHTLDLRADELFIGGDVVNSAFGAYSPFLVPARGTAVITTDQAITISGFETDTYT